MICPACGSHHVRPIFHVEEVPILVCVLWPDEASARACARGSIDLVYCETCGLISNRAFDSEAIEYTDGYENSLHFSEFFQGYIHSFAGEIAARHPLEGRSVVEIGCGDASFLELLVDEGAERGFGFDPSYASGLPTRLRDGRIEVTREYYGPDSTDGLPIDLVVCRQVLEHVDDPKSFLRAIRESLGERDAGVVIEVPNALYTLDQVSLWDVIYEHYTYWSQGSLARLMEATGYDVTHASETFANQFIAVDAKPTLEANGTDGFQGERLEALEASVVRFSEEAREKIEGWRRQLREDARAGRSVALWGTGARGVNFLNIADVDGTIEQVVDINERKHGLHAAGTGQKIGPPQSLLDDPPDVVVVMNPNYRDEIQSSLREMGLDPEVRLA
ncbi:MAG: class I SAM-dependent methyltransferase [Planctomycetota bacterium]